MMMRVRIVMKGTGFKFSGEILEENETHLTIDDVKLGRTEILKSEIAIKSGVEE